MGSDEVPDVAVSVPLGAGRLTRGFLHHDPPQVDEVKALRDSRPDLSTLTGVQLVARARTMQRYLRATFSQVVCPPWARGTT